MNTTELFNQIASGYDRANRILSFGQDMRWRRLVAKHVPTEKPCVLLDLATGTGDQIITLFNQGIAIEKAVGIDLSQGMLNIARKKLEKYGDRVLLQEANVEEIPFEDQSFDLCTFSFGIRNVQNPLAALAEMRRVTKPGGCCLILEFAPPRGWFRKPYLFYLRTLLPLIGGFLTRRPSAYRYLNQSIEGYASPELFLSWMSQTGWNHPTVIPLLFGTVMLYRADV